MKSNDLFAASRRLRNKTNLGELESLLNQRRIARRQLTCAINRVQTLDSAISDLALALATRGFEDELAALSSDPFAR